MISTKNLKIKNARNTDNLVTVLMIQVMHLVSPSVTHPTNSISVNHIFQRKLKGDKILTIYKSGVEQNLNIYRKISTLPLLLETI